MTRSLVLFLSNRRLGLGETVRKYIVAITVTIIHY